MVPITVPVTDSTLAQSVKLSRSAVGQTAVGQIVNIMSSDVNRFDEVIVPNDRPHITIIPMFRCRCSSTRRLCLWSSQR